MKVEPNGGYCAACGAITTREQQIGAAPARMRMEQRGPRRVRVAVGAAPAHARGGRCSWSGRPHAYLQPERETLAAGPRFVASHTALSSVASLAIPERRPAAQTLMARLLDSVRVNLQPSCGRWYDQVHRGINSFWPTSNAVLDTSDMFWTESVQVEGAWIQCGSRGCLRLGSHTYGSFVPS